MATHRTLILLFLLLWGCSSERKDAPSARSSQRSSMGDSLVTFTVEGVTKAVRFTRDAGIDLAKLQSVISTYQKKPLVFQEEKTIDITGEGAGETLLSGVFIRHDTCIVTAVIRSGRRVIYADTLAIPATSGNYEDIWGYDSTYTSLLPYSLFFIGLENTLRVFDANPLYVQKQAPNFLADQKRALQRGGFDSTHIAAQVQDWEQRLRDYRGKLIWNLSLQDNDTYIWDRRQRKFIVFAAP